MTISSGIGIAGCAAFSIATTMPVKQRLEAIDRSIDRVRMTTIWPSARMHQDRGVVEDLAQIVGIGEGRSAGRNQTDHDDDERPAADFAVFHESLHAAIPAAV